MKSYSKEEQVCQNKDMECSYKYTHDQKLYITAKNLLHLKKKSKYHSKMLPTRTSTRYDRLLTKDGNPSSYCCTLNLITNFHYILS